MTEQLHTFTELDKQIQDGFNRFQESHTLLGVRGAYTQGFIDGIRSNLEELVKAYKLDINKEKDEEK